MFKTETHTHTAGVSNCGRLSPVELIDMYHETGYTTVFISDHFAKAHFDLFGPDLSWEQRTGKLYNAYLKAKAHAEQYGMHILFAPELSLEGNDFLLFGADHAFLNLREDVFSMTLEEFYHHAKQHGITIIQAHPYRNEVCTPQLKYIDGIEVINGNPRHRNYNEKSFALAKEHPSLLLLAGSDAHRTEDVARAAVLSQEPIISVDQFLSLLKEGKLQLVDNSETL